jgi:hypothetical protein
MTPFNESVSKAIYLNKIDHISPKFLLNPPKEGYEMD